MYFLKTSGTRCQRSLSKDIQISVDMPNPFFLPIPSVPSSYIQLSASVQRAHSLHTLIERVRHHASGQHRVDLAHGGAQGEAACPPLGLEGAEEGGFAGLFDFGGGSRPCGLRGCGQRSGRGFTLRFTAGRVLGQVDDGDGGDSICDETPCGTLSVGSAANNQRTWTYLDDDGRCDHARPPRCCRGGKVVVVVVVPSVEHWGLAAASSFIHQVYAVAI